MVAVKRAVKIISTLFRQKNALPKKYYSEFVEREDYSQDMDEVEEKFNFGLNSAIINGGASGIGYAITKEFLKKGMQQIVIVDEDEEMGSKASETLCKEFGDEKVLFMEANVADAKQLDNVYRKSIAFHDIPGIVVNSAGIMNDLKWEQQLKTNMTGCVVGSLLGLQYMAKSSNGNGGIIVNIASILGIIPSSGYPLHTMTQFGVCGFTKALGCGNHIDRTGVKVIGICPGLTKTSLLSNAPKYTINDRFAKEFADEIEGSTPQKPSSVAKGLIEIVDEAKPGSIWVVENDEKPYEVTYPGKILEIRKDKEKIGTEDVVRSVKA